MTGRVVVATFLVLSVASLTACGGGGSGTGRSHVTTTSGAPRVRTPRQVSVFVLNGAGVAGAAASKANQLRAAGYTVAGIGNAPHQTGTVVACRHGLVAESAQLAQAVGPGTTIVAFPSPVPAGVQNADCIVGLGAA